jgi:hypothetical protein
MRYAVLLLAACSVSELDLEGKQCPCIAGYACDTATNLCRRADGDGGIIDTPAVTPCLGTSGPEIYRYAGMFDWQHEDASWMGGPQIVQTSDNAMNSYAFRTQAELTQANGNYHIIAAMKPTSTSGNSPTIGIVMRAQLDLQKKDRYACNWYPANRELRLEVVGGSSITLMRASAGNVSATAAVTMEARITGNPPTLSCCLREYPTAKLLNIMDPAGTVTNGYPGLGTDRAAATFPSFTVFTP